MEIISFGYGQSLRHYIAHDRGIFLLKIYCNCIDFAILQLGMDRPIWFQNHQNLWFAKKNQYFKIWAIPSTAKTPAKFSVVPPPPS